MGLSFYFDSAILGPVYEDGHRDLVMSASVTWDGGTPPSDARLEALLQPWRWSYGEFVLYRETAAGGLQPMIGALLVPVPIDPTWAPQADAIQPALDALDALYHRCRDADANLVAIDPDAPHRYTLKLSQDEADEAPDLPNPQCWPDLLGQASRWPGLLPYRLNLQIALRVRADTVAGDGVYFALPRELGVNVVGGILKLLDGSVLTRSEPTGLAAGQGEIAARYAWAGDAAATAIADARVGGRAKPVSDPDAPLDLATLWVDTGMGAAWTSHDAFAAVPVLVAEACDQPDMLFDALTRMAAADRLKPDVAQALGRLFDVESSRTGLISFALSAWTLRYGVLGRTGSDGTHPLTSILSTALWDGYGEGGWHALAAAFENTPPIGPDSLNDAIKIANAQVEKGAPQLMTLAQLQSTTWKGGGLAFVQEAARTFAWLGSDAGLFAIYARPWLDAVEAHAATLPGSSALVVLGAWWASEARDAYPLGSLVRAAWCTAGASAPSGLGALSTPLRAVMDRLRASSEADSKRALEALLTDIASNPVTPNLHLKSYLDTSGIAANPILANAFHAAFADRIVALRRVYLDGNMRAAALPASYPPAFGDPWPLDHVHDLMLPMDRPGHVDSDDDHLQDLRRQISGVGMLVRQRGKSWKCTASVQVAFDAPEEVNAFRYSTIAGQPPGFVGEMRSTMVAYNGEPWFDREGHEALAIGYEGEQESDGSALTTLRFVALPGTTLPDLKFGQAYVAAPFVIGPGNALPAALADGHPARPIDAICDAAGLDDANIPVLANRPWLYYLRRVPVGAPELAPVDRDTLSSSRTDVFPLAYEVAEINGAITDEGSREPLTLLCPAVDPTAWRGAVRQRFEIQPPQVDMMVWLRQWRAAIAAETVDAKKQAWRSALNAALSAWMERVDAIAATPNAELTMPKFPDPAHDGYRIAVHEVWPRARDASASLVVPVCGASLAPDGVTAPVALEIASATSTVDAVSILTVDGKIVVSGLQAGRIYRIAVSALVDAARFATEEVNVIEGRTIFAPSVLFTGNGAEQDESGAIRFASRAVLAEVATSTLPELARDRPQQDDPLIASLKPSFDGRTLCVTADFSALPASGWQYVRTFILERQRWRWNGRHVDADAVDGLASASMEAGFVLDPVAAERFEEWAFDGRGGSDFVCEYAESAANDPRKVILREDIRSNRRAEYERYRLRARSRYAGLMMDAGKAERGSATWRAFALKFRPDVAELPRPKISMLLPLTGGHDTGGGLHSLACLVQMDETGFDQAGLPERIVVEAEMAGPDVLLSGPAFMSGISLKADAYGPIGHTFDPVVPGAHYRRASWIASFGDAAATRYPWAMVKLRVKREVAADWIWPKPHAELASEWTSAGWTQLPRPSDQILLSGLPPTSASELRVLRDAGRGRVAVVRKAGKPDALKLVREPGFDVMFAVLTYRARDVRGLPGAEQILVIGDAAIGAEGRTWIDVDGLELAPSSSLRLRLLSVQRNPEGRHDNAWTCHSLSDLFARVGEEETSDARFRLMRVSLPIEEI